MKQKILEKNARSKNCQQKKLKMKNEEADKFPKQKSQQQQTRNNTKDKPGAVSLA